jgi:transcriptional regulator with XRE-family HTH domain
MPESNSLGGRLRWLREFKELTLQEFAARVGCDSGYLSKLENGKSNNPSKRFLAAVVVKFWVNQHWLLTGDGNPFWRLIDGREVKERPSEQEEKELQRVFSVLELLPDKLASNTILGHLLKGSTLEELQKIWAEIRGLPNLPTPATIFWNETFMRCQAQKMNWRTGNKSKDLLDTPPESDKLEGMKTEVPTWPELKKKIIRLTGEHGAKAALAQKLGVSRQVLGNWLSDDSQGIPNAVFTLQLLDWVKATEGK